MILVDRDVLVAVRRGCRAQGGRPRPTSSIRFGDSLASVLDTYEINTRLRVAHFLAQVAHESDGFCTTEEYAASGAAYEGRRDLGNTQPGDGRRFKGRGLIQLTGRASHAHLGGKLGVDPENNPEMAAEPNQPLRVACEYWKGRKLNQAADGDDLLDATRRVNGGQNGLDARRAYLVKAKRRPRPSWRRGRRPRSLHRPPRAPRAARAGRRWRSCRPACARPACRSGSTAISARRRSWR